MRMSEDQLRLARRRVQDRNRRFKEMAPARKRVAIAKDVIRMLKEGGLRALSGAYLRVDAKTDLKVRYGLGHLKEGAGEKQLQELLCGAKCTVCGIGGAFVAAVLRADECTVNDLLGDGYWGNDSYMRKYLQEWFTSDQVCLIECAFECNSSFGDGDRADDAAEFGSKFGSDKARLRAIMENIVSNGGTFDPPEISEE